MASFSFAFDAVETYLVIVDEDGSFLYPETAIEEQLEFLFTEFQAGKYFYSAEETLVAFVSHLGGRWLDDKPKIPGRFLSTDLGSYSSLRLFV